MGHKIATNSSQIEPSYVLEKRRERGEDVQDQSVPLHTSEPAASKLRSEMMKQ